MPKISQRKTPVTDKLNAEVQDFPIVGIGASAGGLEAMEAFFKNVPSNPAMAFVVIQHLDPKQKGYLVELLQRSTSMQVLQAANRLKIEANTVYVIPPNKAMSLKNGTLLLSDPIE